VHWIDALCGPDPVSRYLHERLDAFARERQWTRSPIAGGCQWIEITSSAEGREAALTRSVRQLGDAIRTVPPGATALVLANSTVAARLGDLRPTVLNARLITRDVYLYAADPDILCRPSGRLRVGYLRGTARRAEIASTLAFETKRPISDIDAREVNALSEFQELLGEGSDRGLDLAAVVAGDFGGTLAEFQEDVVDARNGAIVPVSLCGASQQFGRLEPRLDGNVSYLRVTRPPQGAGAADLSVVALVRPGQAPETVERPGLWTRWTQAVFGTVQASGDRIEPSDFPDFPVLLAVGPGDSALADDAALRQVLSHCYFEGMFDALTEGLNPCRERSEMLFGVYLLGSYLGDTESTFKGCALQAYYELVSTMPGRAGRATAARNADLLRSRLDGCLARTGPVSPAASPVAAGDPAACSPTDKDKYEARDYGPHYAYYRTGLNAIAEALAGAPAARQQSLRVAESCLIRALELSTTRTCDRFSQGLFVVPYEPSLPLGVIRLKGGT